MGTPYTKNPTWNSGGAPGMDAAALNNLETQYDKAKTYIDEILAQVDYQVFTTPGSATWTKPTTCKYVFVVCIGGGGGGQVAAITNAGGGGGGRSERLLRATDLGATEAVTVGAGGAAAGNGGNSLFGVWVKGVGGKAGGLGGGPVPNTFLMTATTSGANESAMIGHGEIGGGPANKAAGTSYSYKGTGGQAEKGGAGGGGTLCNTSAFLQTGKAGGVSIHGGGGGGGGGGNLSPGYVGGAGGATGYTETEYGGGGAAGAIDGNGGNGANGVNGFCGQGGGGGGGSYTGTAGNGGTGGAPGGGGGGGGKGVTDGTPGAGGRGEVRVYTW